MSKHTPGPWFVDGRYVWSRARKTKSICEVPSYGLRHEGTDKANARLIAAAPDMLEALENLENDNGTSMPPSAWALVQAAIAKAKGEMGKPVGNLEPGQPEYFISVFKTRKDAVAFAGGDEEIMELHTGKTEPDQE